MADVSSLLSGVNFGPALSALLGVTAAGIAFFIAALGGAMVLKTVRQVMGLSPIKFEPAGNASRRGRRSYRGAGVAALPKNDWQKPCVTSQCKESVSFFSDSRKRDQKYRVEDSRAVYEYHKRENARFGIEI